MTKKNQLNSDEPSFWEGFLPKLQGGQIEDADAPGMPAEISGARMDGDMIVIETDAGWQFNMKRSLCGVSAGKDEKTIIITGLGLQATITMP